MLKLNLIISLWNSFNPLVWSRSHVYLLCFTLGGYRRRHSFCCAVFFIVFNRCLICGFTFRDVNCECAQLAEKLTLRPSLEGIERLTALFNNMRTLKFKAQSPNTIFATVSQTFSGFSQHPTMLCVMCSTIRCDYRTLGSSRKLGGAAEHWINERKKRICGLSFEF